MILLSDITATETTNMNIENKEVTLRSEGNNAYSVFRGDSLITQLLNIRNSNTVTTTNIIFDGNNVNATTELLRVTSSTLNFNEQSVLKNSINVSNTGYYGSGILVDKSTLNMRDATITNNKMTGTQHVQGTAISVTDHSIFNLYSGLVSNNWTNPNASISNGAIMIYISNFNMYGGIISNNIAKNGAGICMETDEIHESNLNIFNGEINNNNATEKGGGIYARIKCKVLIKGGTIMNNTAPTGPNTQAEQGGQIIDQR